MALAQDQEILCNLFHIIAVLQASTKENKANMLHKILRSNSYNFALNCLTNSEGTKQFQKLYEQS